MPDPLSAFGGIYGSNEVREPTWHDTQTELAHIEAKISVHLSGVDKRERRKLWLAIHRLGAFVMKAVVDENLAAIGRDRQGWIDQQMERLKLAGLEESEPGPKGRPPFLRRVK